MTPRTASPRTATHRNAPRRNASPRSAPPRPAPPRPATHRNGFVPLPIRNASPRLAAQRIATPRYAPRHGATQRYDAPRNAPLRAATRRNASQRNDLFVRFSRRSASPRAAAPRLAPLRLASLRNAPRRNATPIHDSQPEEKIMREVIVEIEGLTAYSASKPIEQDLRKGETIADHEMRRWKEKAHVDEKGFVFVPGVAFKCALDEAAKKASEKIKGKGNQTYTGQFESGVVATSDMPLGIHVDELKSITIFAHSNGKRMPGTRVNRVFPYIPVWRGKIEMRIFNDRIPEDVFERFFAEAGLMAGVGRGRPSTGSPAGNGRFRPIAFQWRK